MSGGTSEGTRGAAAALGAYLIWGLFPLYFNTLAALPPVEVLANGVIGSAVFSFAVLGERVSHRRQAAIAVMTLGVAWLVFSGQGFPWVALTLALSFGAYGLLRKTTPVPELARLLIAAAGHSHERHPTSQIRPA